MSNQNGVMKVYYHVMCGDRCLFADERIKWHLLDAVAAVWKKQNWKIYAFCLMDDRAYFITETGNAAETEQELLRAAERTLEYLCCSIWGRPNKGSMLLNIFSEELNSLDEITGRCVQIHRRPLRQGYVRRLSDYWWSSYNTYIGSYNWQMIDCEAVLMYFSSDQEDAVRMFRRCHRTYVEDDLS